MQSMEREMRIHGRGRVRDDEGGEYSQTKTTSYSQSKKGHSPTSKDTAQSRNHVPRGWMDNLEICFLFEVKPRKVATR